MQSLVTLVVINFVLTFSISGISKLGHVGGFVTGILAGVAIGGLPSVRARIPTSIQAAGLAGLLGLIVVVVVVRTATW
jgi:hypothetical protein